MRFSRSSFSTNINYISPFFSLFIDFSNKLRLFYFWGLFLLPCHPILLFSSRSVAWMKPCEPAPSSCKQLANKLWLFSIALKNIFASKVGKGLSKKNRENIWGAGARVCVRACACVHVCAVDGAPWFKSGLSQAGIRASVPHFQSQIYDRCLPHPGLPLALMWKYSRWEINS